jgi:hypothetical protein
VGYCINEYEAEGSNDLANRPSLKAKNVSDGVLPQFVVLSDLSLCLIPVYLAYLSKSGKSNLPTSHVVSSESSKQTGSQAKTEGVMVSGVVLAEFNNIMEWSEGPRPICFLVFRDVPNQVVQQEQALKQKAPLTSIVQKSRENGEWR